MILDLTSSEVSETTVKIWRLCPLRTPRGRLLSVSYGLKRCYTAPLQPDAVFETKPWVSRKPETPRPRDPDPRPCTLLASLGLASCRFLSPVELASLDVRACPALTTWRPCGGGDALACPRPALNPRPALMVARCLGPVCSPQLHHSPSPHVHILDGVDRVSLQAAACLLFQHAARAALQYNLKHGKDPRPKALGRERPKLARAGPRYEPVAQDHQHNRRCFAARSYASIRPDKAQLTSGEHATGTSPHSCS